MAAPDASLDRTPHAVSSGVVGFVKWLLTSAGLSGLFVASGYVVETAYQKFLGSEFPDLATSDYVVCAGGFLLDSITCVVTAVASHILGFGAVAALLLVLVTVWWKLLRGRADWQRWAGLTSWVPLTAVVVLGLGKMVASDVPAAYVEGVLTRRASATFAAPQLSGLVKKNAYNLQRQIVCAHNQDWNPDLNDTEAMKELKGACGAGPGDRFQEELRSSYLWNLGITAAVLSLGIAWMRLHIHATGRTVLVSVLLLFNLVGLCEAYARTMRGTAFRSIGIWHEKAGDIAMDPAAGEPNDRGILLWAGSKLLLLYDTSNGKVQQISREKITRIQVEPEPADVLAEHIKVTNRKPDQNQTGNDEPSGRQHSKKDGGKKK